jgi:hypothetical protein
MTTAVTKLEAVREPPFRCYLEPGESGDIWDRVLDYVLRGWAVVEDLAKDCDDGSYLELTDYEWAQLAVVLAADAALSDAEWYESREQLRARLMARASLDLYRVALCASPTQAEAPTGREE